MTQKHSPNDDRSNVKNPNNPQYEADRQHRIREGHGNAPPPPQPGTRVPQPIPTTPGDPMRTMPWGSPDPRPKR